MGKIIYLLTIRKISDKRLKSQENDDIQFLGGPIQVTIERVQVINENKLVSIGMDMPDLRSQTMTRSRHPLNFFIVLETCC